MSTRKLKPHRIIPDELYVLRDADRQLKSIIDDMASPGYVLVSRQMGKTNLLLHAKNTYRRPEDVYVYFDLSNAFNNEYECFRSLIDKAIDTNQELLENLTIEIEEIRERNYPAHIEHLQELRLILKTIEGKMVVIFDEIDALTRASFSDRIFSQIRSIYFERDNYKELNRLTYILSGVAEPAEIIKDPKISPFNIGQKIFLDDFSFEEHTTFLLKAELNISNEISKHVFNWTSGNPRMTYDICSEIELMIANRQEITASEIDFLIKKLYLTTYDKAPIDHIRELVEHDKEIRDAIMIIRYGKGSEISDSTKIKLYLSGIVNSDFTTNNIKIKNSIIDESLNEKWLINLDKKKKNISELIAERISNKEFLAVIDIYNQYDVVSEGQLSNSSYYNIALSFYRTAAFEKAIELFSKVSYDRVYEKSYYLETQFLLAESYSYTSQLEKAIELFRGIIEYDDGGKYYYPSKLYLAKTLIGLNFQNNYEEAINLYEEILNNIKKVEHELDEGHSLNIILSAHLYYGILLADLKRLDAAKLQYEKALAIAKPINIPQILLHRCKLENNFKEKRIVIQKILHTVIEEKLIPNLDSDTYPYFSLGILHNILNEAHLSNPDLFLEFCEYILNETDKANETYGDALYSIGAQAYTSNEISLTTAIFDYLIFRAKKKISSKIIHSCYHVLYGIRNEKFFQIYLENYTNFLFTTNDTTVGFTDVNILFPAIDWLYSYGDTLKSQSILVFLKAATEKPENNLKSVSFLVDYHEIRHLLESKFNNIAIQRGRTLLNTLNKLTEKEISGNPFLRSSFNELKNSLYALLPRDANVNYAAPKFGTNLQFKDSDRINVKYQNGLVKSNVKFRKVKTDLENGNCELIVRKLGN